MSKLLKVGGVTNSGTASGVLLSDDGVVQVNTPQKDFYFGSVLEPVPAGFVGARGIFGLKCRASKSTSVGTRTLNGIAHKKSGEIVMIDVDGNMCVYDQSLTLKRKFNLGLGISEIKEVYDGHGDDVLVLHRSGSVLEATLVTIYGDKKVTKTLSSLVALTGPYGNDVLKTETGYIATSVRSTIILELDKDLNEIGRNDVRASHPELPGAGDVDKGVSSIVKLDENSYALAILRSNVVIVVSYDDVNDSRVVNVVGESVIGTRDIMVSDQYIYFLGGGTLKRASASELSGESISAEIINANLTNAIIHSTAIDQSGNILLLNENELVKVKSSGDVEFRLGKINNVTFKSLLYLSDRLYVLTAENFYLLSEDLQLKGYSLTE